MEGWVRGLSARSINLKGSLPLFDGVWRARVRSSDRNHVNGRGGPDGADSSGMTSSKLFLSCLVISLAACGGVDNNPDGGGKLDGGGMLADGGYPPTSAVNLGSSGNFAILAKSGVSTVPPSVITGDVGVSPAAATFVTGFSLVADATSVFATSPQVTGKIYASDYAAPTPSNLTTAISDMELAFTAAAGKPAGVTELGAGNLTGKTLTAGVYKWGTGLLIPTNLTLKGTATDVFVFQVAQDLTVSNGVTVVLSGGVLPRNVFWQVAGRVVLGTTSHFEGVVLSQTSITAGTGASINGRLLAQTAVNLDSTTVVAP